MQLLATEILAWVIAKYFNLDNYSNNSRINSFLEVGLDHPDELHDLHDDYPLASEKITVTEEMLSKYQLQNMADNKFFS